MPAVKALWFSTLLLFGASLTTTAAQAQTNLAADCTINGLVVTGTTANFGSALTDVCDGNTDGVFVNGSVYNSNSTLSSFWQIDLGAEWQISEIVIHNRTDDCCENRLAGAVVTVLDSSLAVVYTSSALLGIVAPQSLNLQILDGQFVRVDLTGTGEFLQLAEVEVIHDIDSDDDGILDVVEGSLSVDTDGDGWPDSIDIDSDGDGLLDVVEGQGGSVVASGVDTDGDGLDDNFEPSGLAATAQDADGDTTPDWRDLNVAQTLTVAMAAVSTGSTTEVADTDLIDGLITYDNQSGGSLLNVEVSVAVTGDHSLTSASAPQAFTFDGVDTFVGSLVVDSGYGVGGVFPEFPAVRNGNFIGDGDGYDPVIGPDQKIYSVAHHNFFNTLLNCIDTVTGLQCPGYQATLLPNGNVSATAHHPEEIQFIGNRLYYPYGATDESEWGLACFDVSAYDGSDTLTGNCDKDSNFSGSVWEDGVIVLGPDGSSPAASAFHLAIHGPALGSDGNFYLLDYQMRLHCVQQNGNLCAGFPLAQPLSTGDANLHQITGGDGLQSSTAILSQVLADEIYFGVSYVGVSEDGAASTDTVVTCWNVATQTKCFTPAGIADPTVPVDDSFSSLFARYDTSGAADAICTASRTSKTAPSSAPLGCITLTGAPIADNDATYCAAYPGVCTRGVPSALLAELPEGANVTSGGNTGSEAFWQGRTYFPEYNTNDVLCWDWSVQPGGSWCGDGGTAAFGGIGQVNGTGDGENGGTVSASSTSQNYGVTRDPDTGCFWVLGDAAFLWSFDLVGNTPCASIELSFGETITPEDDYCSSGLSAVTSNGGFWSELRVVQVDTTDFTSLTAEVTDSLGAVVTSCDFKAETCTNGVTLTLGGNSGSDWIADLSAVTGGSLVSTYPELSVELVATAPNGTIIHTGGRQPGWELTYDFPGGSPPPVEFCLVSDPVADCTINGGEATLSTSVELSGAPNSDSSAGPLSLDVTPEAGGACPFDLGDSPDSYGTLVASDGARHGSNNTDKSATTDTLMLGSSVDYEDDGNPGGTGDDGHGNDDEDGVVLSSVTGGKGVLNIQATVTGFNTTGVTAMLCAYLDGAADGVINGTFDRSVDYSAGDGEVGLGTEAATSGNEELCIQVSAADVAGNDSTYPAVAGFNGAGASCGATATDGAFTCTLDFKPGFTVPGTTYARFRLTTDAGFFLNNSPSPTGAASDGEVEGLEIGFDPTAVTIGKVDLVSASVDDVFAVLGVDDMDADELLALLSGWDAAATPANADKATLLAALRDYLDPDGDGQVAVLRWDTLEERGTIGFYVERQVDDNSWSRINNDLLPGMITAPMGAEYMLVDPGAQAGHSYLYLLIELEATGSTREYGPFSLQMQ